MLELFKRTEKEQGTLELTRRRDVLRWNSCECQSSGRLYGIFRKQRVRFSKV